MSKYKQLVAALAQNLSYVDPAIKAHFHRVGKAVMKELVAAMGWAGQYEIRSNMGGIAVSGEVTLHAENFYVQISQYNFGGNNILFRKCKGMKDYCGGVNNNLRLEDFKSVEDLAAALNAIRANPHK